ncbi:MAG: DASH family cryptochrome [Microcoleaceae cyanobacterium]
MTNKNIIIWYRNDLRVHDHKPLIEALKTRANVIPVYCFDHRQFGKTPFGFHKTGVFRTKFLLESVADLRQSLQELGSDLVICRDLPEVAIPKIAQECDVTAVYYHQEVTSEEAKVERALNQNLQRLGVEMQGFWGHTLYLLEDLPFDIEELPEVFTDFRKGVEQQSAVNIPLPIPKKLSPLPTDLKLGKIPELSDFNFDEHPGDPRAVLQFKGGESAGFARVKQYFWKQDALQNYKETRNGMLGEDYSSKFSPWLSLGCLSPRYIYEQVQEYEVQRVKNDSTYWLIFELLWRDYFHFIATKHGDRIFYKSGLQGLSLPWKEDWELFKQWQEGKTGFPLIDANMRELAATGFMSNRGRQNVASFLTKNLGINWQMGAEWFESLLIDYDAASNWGNWNYSAGIGNDTRGFRYFNIIKQAKDYDAEGNYVKRWLPELANVPSYKVHSPWKLSLKEEKEFRVHMGVDYPQPMINLDTSVKENEKIYLAAVQSKG